MIEQPAKFEFGLGMASFEFDRFRRCARAGDAAGFSFLSVGDNPGAMHDTYVSMTLLAEETKRCRVGTAVTNSIHRDDLVVASALSSIESLAPGRAFVGLATGRARKPSTVKRLRDHVIALRERWTRRSTERRSCSDGMQSSCRSSYTRPGRRHCVSPANSATA